MKTNETYQKAFAAAQAGGMSNDDSHEFAVDQATRKNETKHTPANRPELSFDGCGINGPDEYRTRIATFSNGAKKYGPMFASAPDLLAALKDCRLWLDTVGRACARAIPSDKQALEVAKQVIDLEKQARAAIARATASAS